MIDSIYEIYIVQQRIVHRNCGGQKVSLDLTK